MYGPLQYCSVLHLFSIISVPELLGRGIYHIAIGKKAFLYSKILRQRTEENVMYVSVKGFDTIFHMRNVNSNMEL